MKSLPQVLERDATGLIEPTAYPEVTWDNAERLVTGGVRYALMQIQQADDDRSRTPWNLLNRRFAGVDADPVVLERMKGVQDYAVQEVMRRTLQYLNLWEIYSDSQHPAVTESLQAHSWKIAVRRPAPSTGILFLGGPVTVKSDERLSFTYLARSR